MERVSFERLDFGKQELMGKVHPIINLVKDDDDLKKVVCESIHIYTKYEVVCLKGESSTFSEYIRDLCLENKGIEKELLEFKKLYKNIFFVTNYNNLREDKKRSYLTRVSDIRGLILEELLKIQVSHRYSTYNLGCKVIFDGKDLNYRNDEPEAPLTIDFAALTKLLGEIYECKVSPNNFSYKKGMEAFFLLKLINETFESNNIKCIVGCISLGSKKQLLTAVRENFDDDEIKGIALIGKKEFLDLKYKLPIIA